MIYIYIHARVIKFLFLMKILYEKLWLFFIVLQKEKKWSGIEESWIVFEEFLLRNLIMKFLYVTSFFFSL